MDENHNNKRIFEDNIENNKNQKIGTQTKRKLTEEENIELYNAIKNKENKTAKKMIDIMNNIDEKIYYESAKSHFNKCDIFLDAIS